MAFSNKTIVNSKTGQEIRFIQTQQDTAGEMLEMETSYGPLSKEPPAHYHPRQEEYFHIISGELTFRLDGYIKTYSPGSLIHILPGKVHSMWNASTHKTVVNWKVYPALDTEYFLEVMFGIANDNTNIDGTPALPDMLFLLNKHSGSFRLAKPSYILQQCIFFIAKPFLFFSKLKIDRYKYLD